MLAEQAFDVLRVGGCLYHPSVGGDEEQVGHAVPDLVLVEEVIESLMGEEILMPGHVLFGNCIAPC